MVDFVRMRINTGVKVCFESISMLSKIKEPFAVVINIFLKTCHFYLHLN